MASKSTASSSYFPTLDNELINKGYTLVAMQERDRFQNLYGFGICGANLEEATFEFGAEDIFFTFSLPKNIQLAREESHRLMCQQPSTSGNRNVYPSSKLGVIARPKNKAPVLFFGLCDCPTCKRSTDAKRLNLKSFNVVFRLKFGSSLFEMIEFSFHPTCTENYNVGSTLSKNLKNVVYYTNQYTSNSKFADFIAHLRSIRGPEANAVADITTTIILTRFVGADADLVDENRETLRFILQDDAFADFKLISCRDGKEYNCHKIVLSVQSEELKRIILRKQAEEEPPESRNTLMLTEDKRTIWAFLQWIYYKTEAPISSSFEVASGMLRLAHEYHLPKLVAAAVQVLTQKIEGGDPNWTALWKLYKFVRLVDKIDVVVQLKMEIVKKLAKNLVTKKLEKVRTTATEVMKALNGGVPVDSVIASVFITDVIDLVKFDE